MSLTTTFISNCLTAFNAVSAVKLVKVSGLVNNHTVLTIDGKLSSRVTREPLFPSFESCVDYGVLVITTNTGVTAKFNNQLGICRQALDHFLHALAIAAPPAEALPMLAILVNSVISAEYEKLKTNNTTYNRIYLVNAYEELLTQLAAKTVDSVAYADAIEKITAEMKKKL